MSSVSIDQGEERDGKNVGFSYEGDELRFVIGCLIVENLSSASQAIKFTAKLADIRKLAKAAKRGGLNAKEGSIACITEDGIQHRLARFDPKFREDSIRYQLGDLLTNGMTSLGGALRLPFGLVHIGRNAISAKTKRFSFSMQMRHWRNRKSRKLYYKFLSELDELIEAEPDLKDVPAGTNRLWLKEAIENLGSQNTGVSIENYASKIVSALDDKPLAGCRAAFKNTGDAAGLLMLIKAVRYKKFGNNMMIYLERTLAVVQCADYAIGLPPKANQAVYAPSPKKVIYTVHMRGPYITNGYVTRTYTIMHALKGLGYQPQGATRLGFPNDLARFRSEKIVENEQIEGLDFTALPDAAGGQLTRTVDKLVEAYADRLVLLAHKHRPILLHAASNYINGLAAIVAARRLGIPSIYEVRGLWEITQASYDPGYAATYQYRLQRSMENLAVRSADRVITISEPLREYIIEQDVDPGKVFIVPNGVDVTSFTPEERNLDLSSKIGLNKDEVVVGYVGSIVHYEGLDMLLKAVGKLPVETVESVRIVIVGEGAALESLKKLAESLQIDDRCLFAGRVPREDVKVWYSLIDIAPFPRHSLPVTELVPPLKPFEAMAMEKAVIVSSVRALASEVVDRENGLIFKKNDITDLAHKLRQLIDDHILRKRLGRTAIHYVSQERSIEALGTGLERVYRSLNL